VSEIPRFDLEGRVALVTGVMRSRQAKAMQRQIVRIVFGMLRKRL
jgi:hypothetical protein